MELVREVFRLKWVLNKSNRAIGKTLSISKSTVSTYRGRAKVAGIETIERLNSISNEALKEIIFPMSNEKVFQIDFERINKELKRKHVTLMLLWQEEVEKNPDLYGYSRFCDLFRSWKKEKKLSMKQTHKAGEKGFIDYAGSTVPIHNCKTGEVPMLKFLSWFWVQAIIPMWRQAIPKRREILLAQTSGPLNTLEAHQRF